MTIKLQNKTSPGVLYTSLLSEFRYLTITHTRTQNILGFALETCLTKVKLVVDLAKIYVSVYIQIGMY